ncbi:MAG: NAD(P)H-dependent oxidoreductase, partial [Christensenellaceae bacterium]|nr:NAD(P)H-dependent oxidoreductase [Christensenellaceae bacterium]
MKHILMIVGSHRKDSFNRQLAEAFAEVVGTNAEVSMLSWRDVPLFDQDSEYPTPASVASAREKVLAADALYIVTPEYNFHIPG